MITPTWYLKQLDLFEGISDETIMSIASQVIEKKCGKKEVLYTPYAPANSVYILKEGEVTLYHSHRGKRKVIEILKKGDIWGAIDFQRTSSHFAEVTEDAHICVLSVTDFMEIMKAYPEIMLKFLRIVSQRMSQYEEFLKDGLLDAKEKILAYLHRQQNTPFWKKKKLTHEHLAEHTGLSRETVSRGISALKAEGILKAHEL